MTRTTKTAAAPAPRNNGKPQPSRVRIIKADPATLDGVNLSAPVAALPPHLAAALKAAQASQPRKREKQVTPRVSLTAAELLTLERMGWSAPFTTADLTVTPKPAKRGRNACKGGAAYDAAAAILTAGQSLKVPELAALWLASGGEAKPLNALLKQVANRAGRKVQQDGAILTLA